MGPSPWLSARLLPVVERLFEIVARWLIVIVAGWLFEILARWLTVIVIVAGRRIVIVAGRLIVIVAGWLLVFVEGWLIVIVAGWRIVIVAGTGGDQLSCKSTVSLGAVRELRVLHGLCALRGPRVLCGAQRASSACVP